jgi:hypothetical protein
MAVLRSLLIVHSTAVRRRSSTTNDPFTTSIRSAAVSAVLCVCMAAGARLASWFFCAASPCAHCEYADVTVIGPTTCTPPGTDEESLSRQLYEMFAESYFSENRGEAMQLLGPMIG